MYGFGQSLLNRLGAKAFACAVAIVAVFAACAISFSSANSAWAVDMTSNAITVQPNNVTGAEGSELGLAVQTNADDALFAWQCSADGGHTWVSCSGGAYAAQYFVDAGALSDILEYRCVALFSDGSMDVSNLASATDCVAMIVGKGEYGSVAEAIAAAAEGDTVKLMANVFENVTGGSHAITLDLNGKTIVGKLAAPSATVSVISSVEPDAGVAQVTGKLSGDLVISAGTFLTSPTKYLTNGLHATLESLSYITAKGTTTTANGYRVGPHGNLTKVYGACSARYYFLCSCGKCFADENATTAVSKADYNHQMKLVAEVAATCTTAGHAQYYECSACGNTYADVNGENLVDISTLEVPATGHTIQHFEASDPTCEKAGNLEYWMCLRCRTVYDDAAGTQVSTIEAKTIAALGHDWDEGTVTAEPTCTADGSKLFTCSRCGATKTETIAKLGHNMTEVAAVAPTCSTEGNNQYFTCDRCDLAFKDAEGIMQTTPEAEKLAKTNHTLVHVPARKVSCTQDGCIDHYEWTCCGKYLLAGDDGTLTIVDKSEVITGEKTGHSISKVAAVEATCTSAGCIEHYTCSNCSKNFADKEATEELADDKVNIAALGHDLQRVDYKAPTATEDGNNEYYTCARCGKVLKSDKETETTVNDEVLPKIGGGSGGSGGSGISGSGDTVGGSTVSGSGGVSHAAAQAGIGYEDEDDDVIVGSNLAASSAQSSTEDASANGESGVEGASESEGLNSLALFIVALIVAVLVIAAIIAAAFFLLRRGKGGHYAASPSAARASERREAEAASREPMQFSFMS